MEPAADAEATPPVPDDHLLDRVVAASRLDLEEDNLAPLDGQRRDRLGTGEAALLAVLDGEELERAAPLRVPPLEELAVVSRPGKLGLGGVEWRVGKVEDVRDDAGRDRVVVQQQVRALRVQADGAVRLLARERAAARGVAHKLAELLRVQRLLEARDTGERRERLLGEVLLVERCEVRGLLDLLVSIVPYRHPRPPSWHSGKSYSQTQPHGLSHTVQNPSSAPLSSSCSPCKCPSPSAPIPSPGGCPPRPVRRTSWSPRRPTQAFISTILWFTHELVRQEARHNNVLVGRRLLVRLVEGVAGSALGERDIGRNAGLGLLSVPSDLGAGGAGSHSAGHAVVVDRVSFRDRLEKLCWWHEQSGGRSRAALMNPNRTIETKTMAP